MPTDKILSVSEVNLRIRSLLEGTLGTLWVSGEISGFSAHSSGHWYFKLKDNSAQISCAMFRMRNARCLVKPVNGMQVKLLGLVTLYPARGECQIVVEQIQEAGTGNLHEQFLRLKAQLELEGLFDPAHKHPLPPHPQTIGVITSLGAAALRDVLTTLKRRNSAIEVVIYPTLVQGEGAGAQIAQAIRTASSRRECDCLILCRGGGSQEDLQAFNEEVVARAIFECQLPLVAGVGHETDFTIADFVADQRAPTPTAAAELLSPDRSQLKLQVKNLERQFKNRMNRQLEQWQIGLDYVEPRLQRVQAHRLELAQSQLAALSHRLVHPGEKLAQTRQWLNQWQIRLNHSMRRQLTSRQENLNALGSGLGHLNPEAVLSRGFSIVRKPNGEIVRQAQDLQLGEQVSLKFAQGSAQAEITEREEL
jgi:exodeoxyribonuclease VII large subunit